MFIDREKEIARLQQALQREKARLIVVYGRRRCGKTTLAKQIDKLMPGFSKPVYPDWESILNNLNLTLRERTTLCIDEFPYLVKNSPDLPSIIQKIVDEKGQINHPIVSPAEFSDRSGVYQKRNAFW